MMDLDKKMIGKQFGWLTVIERADSANGRKRYLCRCKCGKEVIKIGKYLRNGATTSCGCVRSKKFRGINSRTYKDLTGKVFGKLTVINVISFEKGRANFLCKCECGNMTIVNSGNLQSGVTKSCGCLRTIPCLSEGSIAPLLEYSEKSLNIEQGTSVFALIRKSTTNTSGRKGVSFDRKRGKWIGSLCFKGKKYKKRFDTKEEAVRYRETLEKELFKPVLEKAYKMGVLDKNYNYLSF